MNSGGYAVPESLNDAINLLTANPEARLLAGGQELLLERRRRDFSGVLVDLRKIRELAQIERLRDGGLKIGAMVTLAQLAASDLVRALAPALASAARSMGDAQLRNCATLGGHLVSADPDADILAVILALAGRLEVVGPEGSRMIPANGFIVGARDVMLQGDEVLVSAYLPASLMRSVAAYERFVHPATLYAICGVCVNVELGEAGRVTACSVGVTGAAEYPTLLRRPAEILLGARPDKELVHAAALSAQEGLSWRSDHFASAEYRRHLCAVLTERALNRSLTEANRLYEAQRQPQAKQIAQVA